MPTGKHTLYKARVLVNGVDLSDHVRSISGAAQTRSAFPSEGMGNTQNRSIPGAKIIENPQLNFHQNHGLASVHRTLQPLYDAGTTFNLVIRTDKDAAVSAENPETTYPVWIQSYAGPVQGEWNTMHMAPVTFQIAGDISIATS